MNGGVHYNTYIESVGTDRKWLDASILFVLSVHYGVDVCVWQDGQDPALIGISMVPNPPASKSAIPLVPIAVEADRHFWGVIPLDVSIVLAHPPDSSDQLVPFTDESSGPARKKIRTDDAEECTDENEYSDFLFEFSKRAMPTEELESELALCKVLQEWCPWSQPTHELTTSLEALSSVKLSRDTAQRCMLRQQVVDDLLYEAANFDQLPESMKYHGGARFRLRHNAPTARAMRRGYKTERSDYLDAVAAISLSDVRASLEEPCHRNKQAHTCLDQFRANPGARILLYGICLSKPTHTHTSSASSLLPRGPHHFATLSLLNIGHATISCRPHVHLLFSPLNFQLKNKCQGSCGTGGCCGHQFQHHAGASHSSLLSESRWSSSRRHAPIATLPSGACNTKC